MVDDLVKPAYSYLSTDKPVVEANPNAQLNPELASRLEQAQSAYKEQYGKDLPITSKVRSRAEQQDLYNRHKRGEKSIYMPIDPSKYPDKEYFHTDAADISTEVPEEFLNQYGLHRPLGKADPVHTVLDPKYSPPLEIEIRGTSESPDNNEVNLPFKQYLDTNIESNKEPSAQEQLSTKDTLQNTFNNLTNPSFLGKDIAAKADVAYGGLLGAGKFIATPFAKLVDTFGDGKTAQEALNRVENYMGKPLGKAFGITNDPVYKAEAATKILDTIGQYADKPISYIAQQTGLPKEDISWFANAAGIKLAPILGKSVTAGAEAISPALENTKIKLNEQFENIKNKAKDLVDINPAENPNLRSVGAAELDQGALRIARANELPIPIELERSQVTRHPADVRFARETTKDPVFGQLFQEKYASDNAKIQQNLDHLVHETGAEYTEAQPSTVGKMLRTSVEKARDAQKQKVETAYNAAKKNGETAELVNAAPVQKYLDSLEAEEINAPVITSAKIKLKKLLDKEGNITINDLEEIRKLNNTLSQSSPTNGHFAKEINKQIDAVTEGKGGENYRLARDENIKLNDKFNDNSIVQDIIGKTGKEYKNALADLNDKVMIKGTAEDITHLFNVLDELGPEGQIIKNELRGHVAQHIKNRATNGVQLDINGKPYVNTRNLDSVISALDRSDKLDLLFGKKNAEHYRTLNEVTKDLQTIPRDTTNPSGTSSSLLAALATMGGETALTGLITGVPAPIVSGATMIGKNLLEKRKNTQKMNMIKDFLEFGKEK